MSPRQRPFPEKAPRRKELPIIRLPPIPKEIDRSHIMHSVIFRRNFILFLQAVADLAYGNELMLPADLFAHALNVDIHGL